jgi:hypothetical protein
MPTKRRLKSATLTLLWTNQVRGMGDHGSTSCVSKSVTSRRVGLRTGGNFTTEMGSSSENGRLPAPRCFAKRNVKELRGLATGDREQMWDGPSESALLLHSLLGTGLSMVGSWLEKVAGLKTGSDLAVSVLIDKELSRNLPRQKSACEQKSLSIYQVSEHAIEKIQVHQQWT